MPLFNRKYVETLYKLSLKCTFFNGGKVYKGSLIPDCLFLLQKAWMPHLYLEMDIEYTWILRSGKNVVNLGC